MNWDDKGYLISKNKYNENSLIAEIFTKQHGKVSGIIFGATSKKIKNYLEQYYQIGIAPYLCDYGDLHTWIMLKSKKNSLENNWTTYPALKFFKGNTLIEVGYHKKINWDVHLMYRF